MPEDQRTIEGKSRDEIWQLLEAFASEHQEGPVWIHSLPILSGNGRGILCEISQTPGFWENGSVRFRPLPGRMAFRIDVHLGHFPEPDLFWQTVDELLRILGILRSERKRAGRKYPPEEEMRRVVEEYEDRKDEVNQEKFAEAHGITARTLRRWRKHLEELG